MPSSKNIKYTISRPEFTPGTAEARKYVLPITALGDLDKKVERGEDPAVVGSNMLVGEYPLAFDVGGSIPLSPRPCGGFAALLKSQLGREDIPTRIGGIMRVRYTGGQASCKLVAASDRTHGIQECDLTGKTLATATGLAATTQYYFTVTIDGGAAIEYDITTGTVLTYDVIIRLMNEAMNGSGAYFSLVAGDLRCTSQSKAAGSTIVLAAGVTGPDLFAALTDFVAFEAAVDGIAGVIITLDSYIGAKGAEVADNVNFGVGGSYDLTAAANDTMAELAALIAADTGYEAEILFGAGAQDTQNIVVFMYIEEMILTLATVLAGETVTINGLTFTAHADTTTPADREFDISGTDTQDAAELVTCINDPTYGVPGVVASSALGVITLVATNPGRDAIVITSGHDTFGIAYTSTAKQAKDMWAYILFVGNTSTGYAHVFTSDLSDAERPVYSVQKDGLQDNFLYSACVANNLSLNAALKGFADGNVELIGFEETIGQAASLLPLEDVDPMRFQGGGFAWGETDYNYLRSIAINIANNHMVDGYGIASMYRVYQQKGMFALEGDFNIRLDAATYAQRVKSFAGTVTGMSFYFEGKAIETNIPEMMLAELPYCVLSVFEPSENAGVIDAHMGYKALTPKGILYNDPVTIILVTEDSILY